MSTKFNKTLIKNKLPKEIKVEEIKFICKIGAPRENFMQVLGVQLDPPFLRAALLERDKGRVQIYALKSAPLVEPSNVKLLYTPPFKGRITSGLSNKDLLVRPVELKVGKNRHLEQILAFQSEATSHFAPKEMLDIPYFIKKGKEKTEALLFTISREALRDLLRSLQTFSLDPDQIGTWPLALVRYARWKWPLLCDAFLVDLSASECTCSWMEKGELKRCHSLRIGTDSLLRAFWEDRKRTLLQREAEGVAKQLDLLKLNSSHAPSLFAKLSEFRQELAKVLFSFYRESSQRRPLFFTGGIDAFLHFIEFLSEPLRDWAMLERTPDEDLKYAICIGLALEPSLQLLREEFFPQKNKKRLGYWVVSLCATSLLLSTALFFAGTRGIESRKTTLSRSIEASLSRWHAESNPTISPSLDLQELLGQWSNTVEVYNKEYPFILQVPNVTETLSWLTLHPLLKEFEKEGDPMQIKEIHYQLTRYPKIGSLKEPYQAKVEMEFLVKSPMTARKFHEFLLKGEGIVDARSEISWESLNEGYRTSFFLKTRRPHGF